MRKYLRYGAVGLSGGFLTALTAFLILSSGLPDPTIFANRQINQSTKIYDRAGEILLYEIYGEEKRTVVLFDQIPDIVKKATLAIEDVNFYKHSALDLKSVLRAFIVNLLKGRITQGGSTITQQLAKNAFLTPERTITRKLKELILAFRLENRYSKEEIFNLYLNQIPYGSNAYGIEAAAKTFFGKPAKELTLAEAALLTALPKAPSYYSPYGAHVDELMKRKGLILDRMEENGFINKSDRDQAKKTELVFEKSGTKIKAPHFVIAVQEYLNNKYGEDFVRTTGLKVITTLDWKLQEIAEKIVLEGAKRNEELYKGTNAALIAEDATTGQIITMVGSRDYFDTEIEGNFNVAVQGLRQPGSAIKPFVYLTAFIKGFTPDTVLFDVPTEFAANNPDCPPVFEEKNIPENIASENPTEEKIDECYHPHNFDEKFRGPVALRDALAQSINVPAVKTLYLAGIDNFLKLIKKFDINTLTERSRYGLSLVLGGGEIKMTELVNAYSVLAQDGIKHKQTMILEVKDFNGKILEEYKKQPEEIVDPRYVRLINDILSDENARRPLYQNSFYLTVFDNHEVAMKTGTTNDYRDAWTFGYTPSLVVGVWAGNNDNAPMQKRGSSILAAVPIWNAFVTEALKDRPTETFIKPESAVSEKKVLNGEYPEIHSILYYVDKNNPAGAEPRNPENDCQFTNWEEAIRDWVSKNAGFVLNTSAVNVKIPPTINVNLKNPLSGSFIINNQIIIDAEINAPAKITQIEVLFNNAVLYSSVVSHESNYRYQTILRPVIVNLQNLLKITVWDSANNKTEKEIILYGN